MSIADPGVTALARELFDAYTTGSCVAVPPSARNGNFDLAAAYAVETELTRLRRADGHVTVGRKVGFANKAVWRVLKLQTVVWASMYDDTVRYAEQASASLSLARMRSPRIEPEVVLKLRDVPASSDPAAVLAVVEWVALGFEFVDCPFPDWKCQPTDFVASLGLHAGLIVGTPRLVDRDSIPSLVDQLGAFKVKLSKNGELVEEGSGRNALRSPALCLAELASAIAAQPGSEPLRPGELISTGTLTAAQPVTPGERWTAEAEGMDVPAVAVSLNP